MEHPDQEAIRLCPKCGNGTFQDLLQAQDYTATQQRFWIKTCTLCGLAATSPRPRPEQIAHYYRSATYISHTNNASGIANMLYQWARKGAIRNKHRLIARYHQGGSVLDIGCGTGEFLGYLKSRGYHTQGVEPSLEAREMAIRNHALPVVPGLESIAPHEQYSVITLWHVLEHLYDPHTTLKQIHARAKSSSLLVIAVPDRESWDAHHYGAEWAAYDVPRHLFHYRRADIHALLQTHGFQVIATKRMLLDSIYVSMLTERNSGRSPALALILGTLIGAWSNLASFCSSRPTSSTLYLARKS
ncbi:MAG TPA: class I SAM-dependent methyltransferase [Flavobacteriales bacterium]